jgi:endonuclease IV
MIIREEEMGEKCVIVHAGFGGENRRKETSRKT